MSENLTAALAAQLREPFADEHVGKLPRVWCRACRDAQRKHCDNHRKVRCSGCGNTITEAHLHLDYVGHAEITDRLLQVDPTWVWEPVAFDPSGLPALDRNGGLWIRLTVAGITRLGYGAADGKTGPDAIKETIGDALRNAAMRFGVALDLWGAKFKESDEPDESWEVAKPPTPEQVSVAQILAEGIDKATDERDITETGVAVAYRLAQGEITQVQRDQLARRAAAKLAELRVGSGDGGES